MNVVVTPYSWWRKHNFHVWLAAHFKTSLEDMLAQYTRGQEETTPFVSDRQQRKNNCNWMNVKKGTAEKQRFCMGEYQKKKEDISMNHPHLTLWLLSSVMQTDSISDHCLYQPCPTLSIPDQSRLDSAQHRLWPPSPGQPSQVLQLT